MYDVKNVHSNSKTVKGYMCLTDFEWHLGADYKGSKVYTSIESLKEQRGCLWECGIVEVEVTVTQVIQEPLHG